MSHNWIPLRRVGCFEFGSGIADCIGTHHLVEIPEEYNETVGWKVYRSPGDDNIRIFSENGEVVSVACYDECLYQGVNLIGLSLEEFVQVVGSQPLAQPDTILVDDGPQKVFEFDDVEAQVWVKDEKVVTVFCGTRDEHEEKEA